MPFDYVPSEQFFDLLYNDQEFCEGLGKVMLSASKLESNIRKYLKAKHIAFKSKATLGNLVTKLKENNLLSKNGQMHFGDLAIIRNYFAHNLYGLFVKEIEETMFGGTDNLTAEDIDYFIYRVHVLTDDFFHFAEVVSKADITSDKLI